MVLAFGYAVIKVYTLIWGFSENETSRYKYAYKSQLYSYISKHTYDTCLRPRNYITKT